MFVVFYSKEASPAGLADPVLVDYYDVVEKKDEAEKLYRSLLADISVYCAGLAPIARATEEHWLFKVKPSRSKEAR
jgi:hypothetical protein